MIAILALPGCEWFHSKQKISNDKDLVHYQYAATQIEYPNVETPFDFETAATPAPLTIDETPKEYWDMKLEEAVQLAMANSKVLRELGGVILRSPESTPTTFDPSIRETDPRFGVEAALSAFDAAFATSAFIEKNDKALNNTFFGGGTRLFQQDAAVFQSQLTKRAATGTQFTARNNVDYDANNAPGNAFPSAWNINFETEIRHPLLLGGGVDFNRIAGPTNIPGLYNGVLLARINTDISLVDFEIGVRNFVSNVENAYWDLYFAYRDLDSKIKARDAALETWRRIRALYDAGRRGGEAEKEAQARELYFRFQLEVENSLNGRLVERTHTNNGSSGGTFRGTGGVHVAERRLRLLLGLPISDGRLIRPADEPVMAKVFFDWDEILVEALTRRGELRRRKWLVKRREKELIASKKFLLPTWDAIGRYRWRGFGRDLFPLKKNQSLGSLNSAWDNLVSGRFAEWQLGMEFSMPIGMRRGHVAVRNAELRLARERALLKEQEREVVHDLSNSIAETNRAFTVLKTSYNSRIAAKQQRESVQAAYDADNAPLDLLLDAHRRLAEADSRFYRALTEYAISVKNVHFEKGSLLDYNEIYLDEGDWPMKAYKDAKKREKLRSDPLPLLKYFLAKPQIVSEGIYPQLVEPSPFESELVEEDVAKDAFVPPAPGVEELPNAVPEPSLKPVPLKPVSLNPIPSDEPQ